MEEWEKKKQRYHKMQLFSHKKERGDSNQGRVTLVEEHPNQSVGQNRDPMNTVNSSMTEEQRSTMSKTSLSNKWQGMSTPTK